MESCNLTEWVSCLCAGPRNLSCLIWMVSVFAAGKQVERRDWYLIEGGHEWKSLMISYLPLDLISGFLLPCFMDLFEQALFLFTGPNCFIGLWPLLLTTLSSLSLATIKVFRLNSIAILRLELYFPSINFPHLRCHSWALKLFSVRLKQYLYSQRLNLTVFTWVINSSDAIWSFSET
jgi:hypothetical protein